MAFNLGTIFAALGIDISGLSKGLTQAKGEMGAAGKSLDTMTTKFQNAGKIMTGVGLGMSAAITAPLIMFAKKALTTAMEVEEVENLFTVSMGNMIEAGTKWSDELSKSLGLNKYAIEKFLGTFNVMLGSMGIAEDKAYEMSKGLTQLAYDMASFYNIDPQEAFEKLQAGISGEAESLKRMGIIINETMVQQYAYRVGIAAEGTQLTENQKIMARYGAIMEQTTKAQGDLERTQDSATNQVRRLKEQFTMLSADLGKELLPMLKGVMDKILPLIERFKDTDQETKNLIVTIAGIAVISGPVLMIVGSLISNFTALKGAVIGLNTATKGILWPIAAFVALNGIIDLGAGKLDRMNNSWATAGAWLLRMIVPLTAVKKGLTDNFTILGALNEGLITNADLVGMNAFNQQKYLDKIKATKDEQENHTILLERANKILTGYSANLPNAAAQLQIYIDALRNGELSAEGLEFGIADLRKETLGGVQDIKSSTDASLGFRDMTELVKIELREQRKAQIEATDAEKEAIPVKLTAAEKEAEAVKIAAELKTNLELLKGAYDSGKVSIQDYVAGLEVLGVKGYDAEFALSALNKALESGDTTAAGYIDMLDTLGIKLSDVEGGFKRIIDAIFASFDSQENLEKVTKTYNEELAKLTEMQQKHTKTTGGGIEADIAATHATEGLAKANEELAAAQAEGDPHKISEAIVAQSAAQKAYDGALKNTVATTKTYTASQEAVEEQAAKVEAAIKAQWQAEMERVSTLDEITSKTADQTAEVEALKQSFIDSLPAAMNFAKGQEESIIAAAEQYGLSGQEIIGYISKMGDKLDEETKDKLIKIAMEDYVSTPFGLVKKTIEEPITAPVVIDQEQVEQSAAAVMAILGELGITITKPTVEVDPEPAKAKIAEVTDAGNILDSTVFLPTVDAEPKTALEKLLDVSTKGMALDGKTFTPKVEVDHSRVLDAVNDINDWLGGIKDKTVTIWRSFVDLFDTGGVVEGYAKGGAVKAAAGFTTPAYDSGGIPAILHKNEVVLNPAQQAKLLFDLANGQSSSSKVSNIFNIAKLEVREEADIRKVAAELMNMQNDALIGKGTKW